MRRCILLPLCFITTAAVCSPSWKSRAQAEYEHHCYLNAGQCIKGWLTEEPHNPVAIEGLDRLDRLIARKWDLPQLSFADRHYLEAYQSWRAGKEKEARNAGRKYLDARRTEWPFMPDAPFREVEDFCDRTRPVRKAPSSRRKPGPSLSGSSRRKTKGWTPASAGATQVLRPRMSAATVAKLAEEARTNGQLERSVRLYRLAGRLDPASGEIRDRLKDVERELE